MPKGPWFFLNAYFWNFGWSNSWKNRWVCLSAPPSRIRIPDQWSVSWSNTDLIVSRRYLMFVWKLSLHYLQEGLEWSSTNIVTKKSQRGLQYFLGPEWISMQFSVELEYHTFYLKKSQKNRSKISCRRKTSKIGVWPRKVTSCAFPVLNFQISL